MYLKGLVQRFFYSRLR